MIQVPPGYYDEDTHRALVRSARFNVGQANVCILEHAANRLGVVVKNAGSGNISVGNDVTDLANDGHILAPGDSLSLVTPASLYAFSAVGTQLVTILEELIR